MSILIKGMKMPKSCADCFAEQCIGSDFGCGVIGFEDGNTTCFTKDRRKDCPLVEVPPHGRLIDADTIDWVEGRDEQDRPVYLLLKAQIDDIPTIIPANKEVGK